MIVTFDGDLLEISYIWKGDYYYCTESRTDRQRGLLRGVLFLQDVLRLDEYRFSIHLPIHPPCRHFSFIDHTQDDFLQKIKIQLRVEFTHMSQLVNLYSVSWYLAAISEIQSKRQYSGPIDCFWSGVYSIY